MTAIVIARRYRRRRWAGGAVLAGLLAVGCADLFAPEPIVTPTLRQLFINDLTTSLRDGGILFVEGYPADRTFRLERGQRVPIEVVVSSGDRDSVGLYRSFCPPRDRGPSYDCFNFVLYMQDGYHAGDLAGHVAAIGGRFELVSVSGRVAAVTVFDPETLLRSADRARSWPGVAIVAHTFPSCAPGFEGCVSLSDLAIPVPVDTGAPIRGDGIVQVRSGDTVTVFYKQPDGTTIQAYRLVR